MKVLVLFVGLFAICGQFSFVSGNAFIKSPTSRSSTWRYFGEATWSDELTQNTEDMMLNCGGVYTNGNLQNKCGVCGDPFNGPRPNEGPNGIYAIKRPTYIYYEGQEINVTVHVTARANGGFFQFKLCKSDSTTAASQACFDANPLKLASTADQTLIQIPDTDGEVVIPLQLPAGINCEYCVMQWTWVTARDWRCENRNGQFVCGMGYGDQPTYVNCADFRILSQGAPFPSDFQFPDYNSEYASIFGGHGGSGTTQAVTTATTTQVQVVTTPAPTTQVPIITDPQTTTPTTQGSGVTTTANIPSTSQIIIITPTPGQTTAQGTTEQPEATTTIPGLTTEKLVPAVIGGGGGAVAAPLFGFGPLSLGLGGLGLLFGLGGADALGGGSYAPMPLLPSVSALPQAVGFSVPQPFMAPAPLTFHAVEEYPVRVPPPAPKRGFGRSWNKGYRPSYNKIQTGRGYGKSNVHVNYNRGPSYNFRPQPKQQFFELPRNYETAPELGYAREPDIEVTKERNVKKNDTQAQSAYLPDCPASEQVCKPMYNGKEPNLYGSVHIFNMICELECLNGKPECPADMCACSCPETSGTTSSNDLPSSASLRSSISSSPRDSGSQNNIAQNPRARNGQFRNSGNNMVGGQSFLSGNQNNRVNTGRNNRQIRNSQNNNQNSRNGRLNGGNNNNVRQNGGYPNGFNSQQGGNQNFRNANSNKRQNGGRNSNIQQNGGNNSNLGQPSNGGGQNSWNSQRSSSNLNRQNTGQGQWRGR